DHQTLQDQTVTLRRRDSMAQERISITDIDSVLVKEISFP
ncbi:MAG: His/Gly/Thr/Pro-type tRNA ligase C-terminal domain-containing protein, partial [Candidatus Nitrosotenuis sp.]